MTEKRVTVWVQSFKDRPTLMLQWIDPDTGRRRSESARTSDPKEAEQKRQDKEYELNHGLHQEKSSLTWATFREAFENEYVAGLRPRSQEKFETVFDVFEKEMKPNKLAKVDERFVSRFVQAMRSRKKRGGTAGLAPMTIRNYLIAMKTALQWAADQKMIPTCPKFPRIKVPKKKPQPIPTEAFEKLLEKETDPLWRAFMCCGWWAGLRLSEVSAMRWNASDCYPWVDFDENRIVLPAVVAKSDEDQWVPLHPELRRMIEDLPRTDAKIFPLKCRSVGKPISRNGITNHVIETAKKAGVKLSMHKLRKGFGCRVAKLLGKGNAPILHRLMRHSSMQVTMDYYASVDDVLNDAIGNLK